MAHRLLYHSTLGSRSIKKKRRSTHRVAAVERLGRAEQRKAHHAADADAQRRDRVPGRARRDQLTRGLHRGLRQLACRVRHHPKGLPRLSPSQRPPVACCEPKNDCSSVAPPPLHKDPLPFENPCPSNPLHLPTTLASADPCPSCGTEDPCRCLRGPRQSPARANYHPEEVWRVGKLIQKPRNER